MYDHIVIDGKNMLYRAVFTARSDTRFQESGHHVVNIILHFNKYYLDKFKPNNFHIFWDTKRSKTWRKEIRPDYKANRESDAEIDSEISSLIEICYVLFNNMGMRQYHREGMEADDLIYAFCRMNRDSKIVIISSDGDLKQISYQYDNVDVHSPISKNKNLIEDVPELDPVLYKSLVGDKSDNIDGYFRVGPVKAKTLVESSRCRYEFFQSEKSIIKSSDEDKIVVGNQRFKDNLRIIDLSLCPHLLDNMMYVSSKQFRPNRFDLNKIRETIIKYKLRGVSMDLMRYVTPFKQLTKVTDGS